jgi:hypothetical protein
MDDEPDDEVESLEIEEGDLSIVIRSGGEVEFIIACDDEDSDRYITSLRMVQYLRFVLESTECQELFNKFIENEVN